MNGWSNRHRELLDNNLKWQHQVEELAGRHEQRIADLEKNLKEKEVYISNIECMLADLSGRVNKMEGKLCHCHKEDIEVAEVEDDDDPTSELSYETVYHTLVAITGLLKDQELESVTLKVAEKALEEDEDDTQVACVSRDRFATS